MRRWMLLVCLASLVPYAEAAKRVTVAQLDQTLSSALSAHKPDAEIAHQIVGLELSERLTETTFTRLAASPNMGAQTAVALQLLADQSAFLNPPASELPSTPAPDDAAQQRMIGAARSYVTKTVSALPNLFAVRTTTSYDDRAQEIKKGSYPVRLGLHLVSTSNQEISIFDERTHESTTATSARWQEKFGLFSEGEFGSTLNMILTDTLKGKVNWSHWEQSVAGPVAVFQYAVPSSASHFVVINSLKGTPSIEATSTSNIGSNQGAGIDIRTVGGAHTQTFLTKAGYHGSLWVDPVSGTVLRTTMEADAKGSAEFKKAAMLVQYGPVQIGESVFICPMRSLALSLAVNGADLDPLTRLPGDGPTQWLNESQFSGYSLQPRPR